MRASLPLLALAFLAACADPEAPDAGTPDLGFADAGFTDTGPRPDATPDSGPADSGFEPDATIEDATPDASVFAVRLIASSSTVTDANPITLTATLMSGTSTVVDFYEGSLYLGSAVLPEPFAFGIAFDATMNGLHTFHAKASSGGGRAVSNDVTIEVAITDLFVDPDTGDDANSGLFGSPLKTLAYAMNQAEAGETIWLLDGVYDGTTQGGGFGTNCPGPRFPDDVDLRAVNPTGVTLTGDNGCAFRVYGSSAIEGIHFYGYQQGIDFYSGSSTVSETTFEDCAMAMYLHDTAEVLWLGTTEPLISDIQNNAFGVPGATVDGDARLTVRGGVVEDILTFNTGVFFARFNGTLILENMTFTNVDRPAFRVYDNAHAFVRDTTFDGVGGVSLGAENAVILIGGLNTATPLSIGVQLERCTMTNNNRHGISISYYANIPTQMDVTLIDTRIQDGAGTAILSNGLTYADPGFDLDITLTNTTLLGGARGIYSVIGNIDIDGGEISGMTGYGIEINNGTTPPHGMIVRNATFDGNGDDAIHIASTTIDVDLGTMASPGNNLMSAIPSGSSALAMTVVNDATAIGNTWMANEQGADAAGLYPAATAATGPASGLNYDLVNGATLLLAP